VGITEPGPKVALVPRPANSPRSVKMKYCTICNCDIEDGKEVGMEENNQYLCSEKCREDFKYKKNKTMRQMPLPLGKPCTPSHKFTSLKTKSA